MHQRIMYSVDVEPDLHTERLLGVQDGLLRFEKICDENKIKPILFVVAAIIKDNAELFIRLSKKGWEISCHGYSHKRFDEMSKKEKEQELKKCIFIWQKYLGFRPKGFRAPQHSIDEQTLDLLKKYGFDYDSSYTPLNFLQLLFFPKKINSWLKTTFSPRNTYNIRPLLKEMPPSSLIIPFVSLTIRMLPLVFLRPYVKILKKLHKKPLFYAHSWDFIKLKKSRIDRIFSSEKFIKRLELIMKYE